MMHKRRVARMALNFALALVFSLGIEGANAQSDTTAPSKAPNNGWQFEVGIYGFATGIVGDATVRNVEAEVDLGFSDILEKLDFGFMGAAAARNENWSFLLDAAYLKLSAEDTFSRNRSILTLTANVDIEFEQTVVEAFVGRKILGGTMDDHKYRVDLLGGARYQSITGELGTQVSLLGLTAAARRERTVDWIDPLIGIRGEYWATEKFRLLGWADYGGFGVGSESTWQVFVGGSYNPTPNIDLVVGYRALAFDYEEGTGATRLALDLVYSGPIIGVAYGF